MTEIVRLIAQSIYDKKGENILALDVSSFSTVTDCFIIAEGTVARHVTALAKHVLEVLRKQGIEVISQEGLSSGWAVLDFGQVIVHIFLPAIREHYALEKMWKEAKVIDLDLSLNLDFKEE